MTVVGGGFVGSTTAQRLVDSGLADVVLTDILEGVPAGKALDMLESAPISGSMHSATGISTGTGDYKATENSDIVVITAGFPRKPGMSRDDLLKANYDVVKGVVEQIVKLSPNAILIIVTNPLDAMAQAAFKISGFPKNRVMGMAGVLDSARMSAFVADGTESIGGEYSCFVLGGHGDDMVPLPRYSTVAGIPLPDLLPKERSTRSWSARARAAREIVNLLEDRSAYYAPSAAAVKWCEAILKDKKKILPAPRISKANTESRDCSWACREVGRARDRADHRDQAAGGRSSGAGEVSGVGEGTGEYFGIVSSYRLAGLAETRKMGALFFLNAGPAHFSSVTFRCLARNLCGNRK